jgi:predicted nuclease of restriction endonuclease-like RecB superfamily
MLTGRLVRVRQRRQSVQPCYIDVADVAYQDLAARLLEVFRRGVGRRRSELLEEAQVWCRSAPQPVVAQGLLKLLEDRCTFAAGNIHPPPAELRQAVFQAAARHWQEKRQENTFTLGGNTGEIASSPAGARGRPGRWDRAAVLQEVAEALGVTPAVLEEGLFADLRAEQRLQHFRDLTPQRLLQRYNVALVQAVLLRAVCLKVVIRQETPQRYRQLLRQIKFHRLVCDLEAAPPDGYCLHLDGPLSLFVATQKYGLQLALFVPALLLCRDFELEAELRWGRQRRAKRFFLSAQDGLVSHYPDTGVYIPADLRDFVTLFRKKIADWDIQEMTELLPLGDTFWAPDYRLVHRASSQVVYLDVLGFWRRASVERHLERLRRHAPSPFVLALGERLRVDAERLSELPAEVLRFRQMPLPEEVVRLAQAALVRWPSRRRGTEAATDIPLRERSAPQQPELRADREDKQL